MNVRTIGQKLKSTKLWCAIAGIATGIAIALGADAGTIQTVTGAVTAVLSTMTYIVTEGKIDATAASKAITATETAIDEVNSTGSVESTTDTQAAVDKLAKLTAAARTLGVDVTPGMDAPALQAAITAAMAA